MPLKSNFEIISFSWLLSHQNVVDILILLNWPCHYCTEIMSIQLHCKPEATAEPQQQSRKILQLSFLHAIKVCSILHIITRGDIVNKITA